MECRKARPGLTHEKADIHKYVVLQLEQYKKDSHSQVGDHAELCQRCAEGPGPRARPVVPVVQGVVPQVRCQVRQPRQVRVVVQGLAHPQRFPLSLQGFHRKLVQKKPPPLEPAPCPFPQSPGVSPPASSAKLFRDVSNVKPRSTQVGAPETLRRRLAGSRPPPPPKPVQRHRPRRPRTPARPERPAAAAVAVVARSSVADGEGRPGGTPGVPRRVEGPGPGPGARVGVYQSLVVPLLLVPAVPVSGSDAGEPQPRSKQRAGPSGRRRRRRLSVAPPQKGPGVGSRGLV